MKQKPNLFELTKDREFKAYFRTYPEILIPMLTNFLPLPNKSKILSVDVLNPELLPKRNVDEKIYFLDLRVKIELIDAKGEKGIHTVNVEMQTIHEKYLTNRLLAYVGRLYSKQTKKGRSYDDLMPVYSLVFTTYNLHEFRGLVDEYYHSCSIMRDQKPHLLFSHGIRFIVIELAKFSKEVGGDLDARDKWCYIFKRSSVLSLDEIKTLEKGDNVMAEALRKLQEISADERVQAELDSIEKFELDMESLRRQREAKGKEEGKAEGKAEVAAKMLAEGVDMETICKCTGLSEAEIEALK